MGGTASGFVRDSIERVIQRGDTEDDGEGEAKEKDDVFHTVKAGVCDAKINPGARRVRDVA